MVRLDRIYTRAGDAGETSLGDGERMSKSSARIWACRTVDETGAAILGSATGLEPASADLLHHLFDLGADLAVHTERPRQVAASHQRAARDALEAACDEQGQRLAPLTSFVLSGGTPQLGGVAPGPHRLPVAPSGTWSRWQPRRRSTRTRCPT